MYGQEVYWTGVEYVPANRVLVDCSESGDYDVPAADDWLEQFVWVQSDVFVRSSCVNTRFALLFVGVSQVLRIFEQFYGNIANSGLLIRWYFVVLVDGDS